MSWRDFFYFSKSERSALIILLCLVTIAGILLINSNDIRDDDNRPALFVKPDTLAYGKSAEDKKIQDREFKEIKKSDTYIKTGTQENKKPADKKEEKYESPAKRAERIITTSRNASRPSYHRSEKFEEGTVIELNTADTTLLKKVPGIGSAYARRIVKFRDLLGGFYSVNQLAEVYGIDQERFDALKSWFTVDTAMIKKLDINESTLDELKKHPYVDYRQAEVIRQLRKREKKLAAWENLQLLDEFTDIDSIRLLPYLSF
ncbi:MAG: helix-hairpin-helix domain-containing protein [Tannerella sp.]|jgi:competence ComEA-like helix-hairpin-helix protein|nr:helix-hairpin-helix domain-containing protein [Tannerella sp.]